MDQKEIRKPLDLAPIRARANHLPHAASVNARDMADEIDRLRDGLREALDNRDLTTDDYARLAALLPVQP